MKTVKAALLVIGLLVLAAIAGAWVFLSTLDVRKYVPQVTEAVFKATGRQLKVGDAGLKLSFLKFGLELKDVSLSDNALFSDQSFLTVARVFLTIDLKEAFLKKTLVVSEVSIDSPEVLIVRLKDGAINAASLAGAPAKPEALAGAASQTAASNAVPVQALPVLLINKIGVINGKVHYIDRSFDPALDMKVDKIALTVNDFSLSESFDVAMKAALFADAPNVTVSGKAKLNLARAAVNIENLKTELMLDNVIGAQVNAALPMVKPSGFKQGSGIVTFDVLSAVADAKGLEALDADVTVAVQRVTLEGMSILGAGLKSISVLPADKILAALPPETQAEIAKGITVIDHLDVLAHADLSRIEFKKAEATTRDFMVSAVGSVLLPGTLDLKASFMVAPALSGALTGKLPESAGLKDDQGRVSVPFMVQGTFLAPDVRPDMNYLTRKLIVGRGKQELEKVIRDPAVGAAVNTLFNSILK
jgi:hypothetical protein